MATDATGTPTTNFSIPKYDTNVDAPSGLGFNAAMDAIDVAMNTVRTTANNALSLAQGAADLGLILVMGG